MRGTEGDDEAVFEGERHIEAHKRARALAQVADIILTVCHVVLNDHVAVADAVVLVLLDHEVVVNVSLI